MTYAATDQQQQVRIDFLKAMGAGVGEIEELVHYGRNSFCHESFSGLSFPLEDEPFVETWEGYAEKCRETGGISFLSKHLVQLRFPIREGMSQLPAYRDVTLRGRDPCEVKEATGLQLSAPGTCRIVIYPSAAGRIPLLIAGTRVDFVSLAQAFIGKNEPITIPDSMGACSIAGYNNWDRLNSLRSATHDEAAWEAEFQRIIPQKKLYQDRFIILSDGPYSDVPCRAMGMSDEEWRRVSFVIRREHECTHYFTRRVFATMRNHLLDELIADYSGICAAAGRYSAAWFLRFVGLENFPRYREGGRLQNYRGDPPLSDAAFSVLQQLVVRAAANIERWSDQNDGESATPAVNARVLMTLTRFAVEELASPHAVQLLTAAFGPASPSRKDRQ